MVFYVPCGLTNLQKELYKVLIFLHRDSLLSQIENGAQDEELNSLLVNNLQLVNNHPFLLVEHYIPKKLLLMESNERLMQQSDKFNKFDKIIQDLIPMNLNLIVIGKNIKELDLIEAFLLERKLICSRSLNLIQDNKLKVYLITSKNLINLHNFQLIISFDEDIKDTPIPLIKLKSINSFNDLNFLNFNLSVPLIQFDFNEIVNNNNSNYRMPEYKHLDNAALIETIQSIDLEFKSNEIKKLKFENLNKNNYQNLLTKLTMNRFNLINNEIASNVNEVNNLKLNSTITNNQEDDLKLEISKNFTNMKKLKDDLFNVEKLNEKLTFENLKHKESITELESPNELSKDEYLKQLQDLKSKNEVIENELTQLRLDYQKSTADAGELSNRLKSLQSKNKELETNLKPVGIDLRKLKNDEINSINIASINKLNSELNFLRSYKLKLDEILNQRLTYLNFGRNGRVHRSTTPYT